MKKPINVTIEPQFEYGYVTSWIVRIEDYPLCAADSEQDALFIQRCIAGMQNYGYDLREMWKQGVGK